ncbi:peroxiredoxin [Propionicimonas paludicola]|uniref:Peroxiredoxin n=1 Tax=Propionicimonas paludicola TaxID=185243 RepID=A0A2A9CU56_9ACTN|nr:peroxiredoxin family protein [Propionicimonas paludicola]PFG17954.1 peroxiredoxin [Propionicimonas paludicola]
MTIPTQRQDLHARQRVAAQTQKRKRTLRLWLSWGAALALVAIIAGMLFTSQTTSASTSKTAPDFTLPTTSDTTVTLSNLRGKAVLLYFNEGAGCGACLMQMTEIERNKAAFDAVGITVLPIVMNTKADITTDMTHYGVTTPFLLDDGTVSKAYGTLGKGMHADLPGHSFVLIDATGVQRWYGEYPSMWLEPKTLLDEIKTRL